MKHLSSRVSVAVVFVFAVYGLMPLALWAWQGRAQRQMAGVPADQALLDGAGPPASRANAAQTLDAQNQVEVRLNVQRLYALATELKDEVDSSNSGAVLSMTVIKRAQDIEKLARQIKDRARR
jgi:hypothetical protein